MDPETGLDRGASDLSADDESSMDRDGARKLRRSRIDFLNSPNRTELDREISRKRLATLEVSRSSSVGAFEAQRFARPTDRDLALIQPASPGNQTSSSGRR